MDMRWAVCGSSSRRPTQEVTSDMKITGTGCAISNHGVIKECQAIQHDELDNLAWYSEVSITLAAHDMVCSQYT